VLARCFANRSLAAPPERKNSAKSHIVFGGESARPEKRVVERVLDIVASRSGHAPWRSWRRAEADNPVESALGMSIDFLLRFGLRREFSA